MIWRVIERDFHGRVARSAGVKGSTRKDERTGISRSSRKYAEKEGAGSGRKEFMVAHGSGSPDMDGG